MVGGCLKVKISPKKGLEGRITTSLGALRAEGPWCAHRAFQRVSEVKNDREIENFRSVLFMSSSEKSQKNHGVTVGEL